MLRNRQERTHWHKIRNRQAPEHSGTRDKCAGHTSVGKKNSAPAGAYLVAVVLVWLAWRWCSRTVLDDAGRLLCWSPTTVPETKAGVGWASALVKRADDGGEGRQGGRTWWGNGRGDDVAVATEENGGRPRDLEKDWGNLGSVHGIYGPGLTNYPDALVILACPNVVAALYWRTL